ncbi:homoserine dehydrogenase [Methylopila henanensis]|uniref:Homoserine dehydrogenase n=1 Tax=Methylopila henanensis TaxID=873516 RepID=A0ABW4KBM7_9HYPH
MALCRVAIAGFGAVGRATAGLLLDRRARYRDVHGVEVRLVAVCASRAGRVDPAGLEAERFGDLEPGLSGPDVIEASGADVLIEAGPSDHRMGGPGLAYLERALSGGRDAIVISKGALVRDGARLRGFARRSGATIKVSGAAGAALPTIDLLDHNLLGCEVLGVEGVLNATTNYLLDAMMARGVGFGAALREAQAGGFAESDPRDDVEGWDTARKLVILAGFGLGAELAIGDLEVRGIQTVTEEQIAGWRDGGLVPKLVGRLWRDEAGAFRGGVGVEAYPLTDPLARLPGKTKAIRVKTDGMGEIVAIGCGAEPLATASAALKDFEHILASRAGRPRLV